MTHDEAFHKTNRYFNGIERLVRSRTDLLSIAQSPCQPFRRGILRRKTLWIYSLAIFASIPLQPLLGQAPQESTYGMLGVAQSPDIQWIESLIGNGFSKFALEASTSRLQLHPQDSDPYAQWLMMAMHSQTSMDLERFDFSGDPQSLDAIRDKLEERSQTLRGAPREMWIRWKGVWCQWLIQQRALSSYLAVPTREPLKQWVIASIRRSLDTIEQLQQDLRKLPTGPGKAITNDQKLDLQGRLALLQADLLYQRSQCYSQGSDDRSAAAAEMLRSLDQALGKLPAEWIHRPALTIARIRGQIQLEQYDDAMTSANRLWDSLHAENDSRAASIQYESALAVVGARVSRLMNRSEDFQVWIGRGGGAMASPELALEQFAGDLARGGDEAAEKALGWKRTIGEKFGSYWEQRADAMIVSNSAAASKKNKTPSLEIMRIEIRQLLTAKRWDEAIEKLRQAEFAAVQMQADEEAFAFGMQLAAALDSQGHRDQAATAFFEVSAHYPKQPKADSASLMGAWLTRPGGDSGLAPSSSQRALYRERLLATATGWPMSDSAKQAVDWLEQDYLAGDSIVEVLQTWGARTAETRNEPASVGRYLLGLCMMNDAWLEPTSKTRVGLDDALTTLRGSLVEVHQESDRENFEAWIATTDSDLRWSTTALQGGSANWFGNLARIVSGSPSNAPVSEAVISEEMLREWLAPWRDDPLARLGILWYACETTSSVMLSRSSTPSDQETRRFDALQRMLKAERTANPVYPLGPAIDGSLQRSVRFYEMFAAGVTGDGSGLVNQLEQERNANKKSAWWLYRSARVLQSIESKRGEAMARYRLMASGFPAGSEAWLEARARTAQTMRWSGDKNGADQLRDLVFATYPAAALKWQERFEAK